jgi:cell division septum initiation protein DivIVA
MSNMNQYAETIRRQAVQYREMQDLADALDAIGSLDQARAEKEKALVELDAQIADGKGRLALVESNIADAISGLDEKARETNASAAQIIADAEQKALALIEKANAEAGAIAQKAKADREATIVDAKKMAAQFRAEADMSYAKTAQLQEQIREQSAELTRLTDAITAARATMAQIMGE